MTTRAVQAITSDGATTDACLRSSGLTAHTRALINDVFQRYPSVRRVVLFGSRAKGTPRPESDVDLALEGEISADEAARIAFDLDDLPLPYHFDVVSLNALEHEEYTRTSSG